MSNEQFTVTYRQVPGYPAYRVGDDGSVWSCWTRNSFGGKRVIGDTWRLMKPKVHKSGHLLVSISPGRRQRFVHHLVLEAFVGPRPNGMEGCHFPDRDPANNRLSNLRWDTKKSNYADSVLHGTQGSGDQSSRAILTGDEVRAIRAEYAAGGTSHSKLAKKYHVSEGNIGFILNGITWQSVA